MNRLFTFLLSLFTISTFAQESADSFQVQRPYTEVVDSALRFLDKSRVPFGSLYDRVFPFARLTELSDDRFDLAAL